MAGYLLIPPAVEAVEKIVTGIIAACKSSASQEDFQKFSAGIQHVEEEMKKKDADIEGLSEALKMFREGQEAINKRIADEIKEQPEESTEQLRDESVAYHGLDALLFYILICGSTNGGKSSLGNWLGALKGGMKYVTGIIPVEKEYRNKAELRRCQREGLEKLHLGDLEGSGTGTNHAHKVVKERRPAGFDFVCIVISAAVMIEDAAMAYFCYSRGIPFTMIVSKMDERSSGPGAEEVKRQFRQHVKAELEARTITWNDDMLMFMECGRDGPEQDHYDNSKLLELITAKYHAKCG